MKKDVEHVNSNISVFDRNPRKAIVFIIIFITVSAVLAAEAFLEYKSPIENKQHFSRERLAQFSEPYGRDRAIRLREWNPNIRNFVTKGKSYIDNTDKLEIPEKGGWVFRTDKNGFILPNKLHEEPDLTIVFLGGSTTECITVSEEHRFPYYSGRKLEAISGLKVNSYNGGVSGNNSLHSIDILINKVVPMNPDIVVMMHVVNDIGTLIHTGTYWNDLDTRKPIVDNMIYVPPPASFATVFSDLLSLLVPQIYARTKALVNDAEEASMSVMDEWRDYRGKTVDLGAETLAKLLSEYESNLMMFIGIARARGITPVLMTQANRFTEEPTTFIIDKSLKRLREENGVAYDDWEDAYDAFTNKVREVGAKENVLVIDLDKEVPQGHEYLYDSVHLNEAGSMLASQIIAERVAASLPVR